MRRLEHAENVSVRGLGKERTAGVNGRYYKAIDTRTGGCYKSQRKSELD